MQKTAYKILLAFALVGIIYCQNSCQNIGVDEWVSPPKAMNLRFGLKDGGGVAPYAWSMFGNPWDEDENYYLTRDDKLSYVSNIFFWINQTPLQPGLNSTYSSGTQTGFTPTANFTCTSDSSGIWGPTYPDYRKEDYEVRGRYQNIQVYVHTSVPVETSYIRQILFVKNIGSVMERFELYGNWYTNDYAMDVSPIDNGGRYYTGFPYQDGDLGQYKNDPASSLPNIINSVHVKGPRGRDQSVSVEGDYDNYLITPTYYTTLAAGEEMALMFILSFGVNKTLALKNAAEIDTEPAFIFHNITVDQLSLVRNWGGCEVIIGPDTTVTVTPPSQCSSGPTSDFTVQATSTRTDLTSGFTHRVIGMQGIELVAPQSTTTLSVPNSVGSVKHQLWYKECLVKETAFTACKRAAPAVPSTQSAPQSTSPQGKTSGGLSLGFNYLVSLLSIIAGSSLSGTAMKSSVLKLALVTLVLVCLAQGQSTCQSVAVNDLVGADSVMQAEFGLNEDRTAPFKWELKNGWWMGVGDLYLRPTDSTNLLTAMSFWINQIPLQPGLNSTTNSEDTFVPTANFTCTSLSSAIFGPSYPDYRERDLGERARYQNLQVYIHFSVPNATSYIRQVVFIKNIGSTPERVRLWGDWFTNVYSTDISPIDNNGRYYTGSPFQAGDKGSNNNDEDSLNAYTKFSVHGRGPKGRDQTSRIYGSSRIYSSSLVSPAYLTILPAGEEMALMYITSFGMNKTAALKNAAEIDTEPAFIFHDLTADQLSMIRNWGGCEVIIGPDTTVTVTPPSQCSSGPTSNFTVQATSTRTDLTSGFTHRVIGMQGIELVAPQSTTTLSVPNGVGSVKHQLWYKECLVKETAFTTCEWA